MMVLDVRDLGWVGAACALLALGALRWSAATGLRPAAPVIEPAE
jgi:hypothetical protein